MSAEFPDGGVWEKCDFGGCCCDGCRPLEDERVAHASLSVACLPASAFTLPSPEISTKLPLSHVQRPLKWPLPLPPVPHLPRRPREGATAQTVASPPPSNASSRTRYPTGPAASLS